jgi:hypothetical protein
MMNSMFGVRGAGVAVWAAEVESANLYRTASKRQNVGDFGDAKTFMVKFAFLFENSCHVHKARRDAILGQKKYCLRPTAGAAPKDRDGRACIDRRNRGN